MDQNQDDAAKLEQLYKSTWMCSNCGQRYPMGVGVCSCCMDRALEADEEKLRAMGVHS